MARKTTYEWVVECYDDNFDIVDARYWDEPDRERAISDAKAQSATGEWAGVDFGLCRRVHETEDGDELEREYYYIEDGKFLPSAENDDLPPKRFLAFAFEGVGR